jgi:hypothetical protein
MADYYPLISRAVSGLSDQSPEMRGAVFDRARSALLEQLRSLDPPLSEEDIENEREGLDRAIAAIEAEYSGPAIEEAEQDELEAEPEELAQDWQATPAWPGEANPEPWRADQPGHAIRPPVFPEPAYPPAIPIHSADATGPTGSEAERDLERDAADGGAARQGFTLPGARQASGAPARRQPSGERAPERARPRVGSVRARTSSGGGIRAAIVALSLVLLIGGIASVAWWLSSAESDAPAPVAVVEAPSVNESGKIAERIGGDSAPAPTDAASPATVAAPVRPAEVPATAATPASPVAHDAFGVAQRAILYEEDSTNPQAEPRAAAGRAVWHLDPPAAGAVDPTIRATVAFADAAMSMTMTIRRNLDPTLPASHTIELAFTPGGQQGRNVRDVGLLQLKDEETVRGAPVAGLPVPVQDNYFLIGLSNIPSDIQRNTNLLTSRNWIDIPIRFAAGQRAIVSFEKGMSGEQVIARAFQAWNGEAAAR